MISFKTFLEEKVLSIGFNPSHEPYREQYRNQIHDILRNSYSSIGGYRGLGSGSEKESEAIHNDISDNQIKATKRGDKITAVNLYKPQFGRKSIASGTDGSKEGKADWLKTKSEDNTQQRSWGEVSGPVEKIQNNLGYPVVPSSSAKELLGKNVEPISGSQHYVRDIGGQPHKKIMMGYPKK